MKRFPHDPADILAALNQHQVKYMVVGGVAAIFHGVPRTTFDTDLAVKLEIENLKRLEQVMRRLGFSEYIPASVTGLANPATRRQWTGQKAMKVFSFREDRKPFRVVDVMVRPLRDFDRLYRQRITMRHEEVDVPVIPIPNLIKLKTGTGRIKDAEDIAYLRVVEQTMKQPRARS
ncbi:MAG: hypothetical protein HYZ92_01995 [Candidatus Omnitrophica bacterium]|nr:hypothetical protein [Candidatus Omnitrophota bacterium]